MCHREVLLEKRERRTQVAAVLQAEDDRRFLREQLVLWDREAVAMAGRDWVVGQAAYETRWMPSPSAKNT